MLPFEQDCIETSVLKHASFGRVRIARPEVLCVMKLIAGRPHDLRDVAQLIETFPKLDREWILDHMQQFAVLMEEPEALERAKTAFS
jgi:hypothetical protein